jgi:hypothetical protein
MKKILINIVSKNDKFENFKVLTNHDYTQHSFEGQGEFRIKDFNCIFSMRFLKYVRTGLGEFCVLKSLIIL